jgi:D-alanine-D-alanine ligase
VADRHSPAWEAPLDLTDAMDHRARAIASAMFEALGCRDMARVDLRVDEEGRIYFLEINPLPSFDPEGTVGLLGEYLGIGYAGVVGRILEAALTRIGSNAAVR